MYLVCGLFFGWGNGLGFRAGTSLALSRPNAKETLVGKKPAVFQTVRRGLLQHGSMRSGRASVPRSTLPSKRRRRAARTLAAVVCALALVAPATANAHRGSNQPQPPVSYWDTDQSATARAAALLGQMTLDEKVDMLHGELNNDYGFYNAPIERLGIPALTMTDGRNGVRLGSTEFNGGRSTLLPSAISAAASWDAEVADLHAGVTADEAFRTGMNTVLSPSVNIARVPQNGRNFESFGEDPLLMSAMGNAWNGTIQEYGGLLGNIQDWAVYTQEYNRLQDANMVVDDRTLQEIYNRPFAEIINGTHPGSVMCGFNKVNGEYSCGNDFLINQILKEQYGFQGFVMSDYNAAHETLDINAGLDQDQPGNYTPGQVGDCLFCQPLIDAVNAGTVSIDRINDAVTRILRPMIGLGLFDRTLDQLPIDEALHNTQSAEAAAQGMVLLKNDDVLPLAEDLGSLAVIGTDADEVVQGGGSSHIMNPTSETSPLAGIQARLAGTGTEVSYVPGTDPVTSAALLPGAAPIPSSFMTPAGGAAGTGLSAEYFLNQDFSGAPYLDRVEPYVGLNTGFYSFTALNADSPHFPDIPQDLNTNMSARWSATLTAPVTGTYELQVITNGKTTLTVDGTEVVNVADFFTPTPSQQNQTVSVPLDFTAGSTHSIELTYIYDTSSTWNQVQSQLKLAWVPPEGVVLPQAANAAAQAAESDAAVVLVRDYSTEGGDLSTLELPNWQADLIRAVGAANPNTVVVLTVGGVVEVVDWQDAVGGVIHGWYPGQNQGTAIASVLFGDVNPSGKLPITLPVNADETPVSTPAQYPGVDGLNAEYTEGIFVGYRGYQQFGIEPAYPFGYGLSYTSFDYSDLRITCRIYSTGGKNGKFDALEGEAETPGADAEATASGDAGVGTPLHGSNRGWGKGKGHHHGWDKGRSCRNKPLQASVRITNTGDTAGSEVVQAYAGANPNAPVQMAPKSLAGWTKVDLAPGESTRVRIPLDIESFSYWDVNTDRWVTPTGTVPVYVGPNSEDTPLTADLRIRPRR